MVPTDFASAPGLFVLAQPPAANPSQPAVPGASGGDSGATAAPGSQSPGPGGNQGSPNPLGPILWMLPLLILVMVIMPSLGQKKQKKQRETMLAGLNRNDRVLTTAGIIGTVVEIRDHEVVVRADENTNTRICFAKSAIQQILRESKDGAKADLELKPKNETANAH